MLRAFLLNINVKHFPRAASRAGFFFATLSSKQRCFCVLNIREVRRFENIHIDGRVNFWCNITKQERSTYTPMMWAAHQGLYQRLKRFQRVVHKIFNLPGIKQMTLFHTGTANEASLDEYVSVNWDVQELAEKMLQLIREQCGILPIVKAVFEHGQIYTAR